MFHSICQNNHNLLLGTFHSSVSFSDNQFSYHNTIQFEIIMDDKNSNFHFLLKYFLKIKSYRKVFFSIGVRLVADLTALIDIYPTPTPSQKVCRYHYCTMICRGFILAETCLNPRVVK